MAARQWRPDQHATTGAPMDKEQISKLVTEEEKNAIAVLLRGGFAAFTECRIEDVRELDTGRRRPTWRNQGRYDLVIGINNLKDRQPEVEEVDVEAEQSTPLPSVDEMTRVELLDEAKNYPQITGEYKLKVDELRVAVSEQRKLHNIEG